MPAKSRDRRKPRPANQDMDRIKDRPVKTAVYLSADALLRLRAACIVENTTQSILIQNLVLDHLSHYYVGCRGRAATDPSEDAA